MSLRSQVVRAVWFSCLLFVSVFLWVCPTESRELGQNSLYYHVRNVSQRLEIIVNSSRILTMEGDVPRAQVNNPEIVKLTPLAANKVQVAGLKPGVTQVNLFDDNENIYTVDLIVIGDARELDMVLKATFPEATLRVRPMNSSVLIEGEIPRPELTSRIIAIAEDYYPKVISNMTVGGVQTVLLHVKVMEVSRTKLRKLGIDWNYIWGQGFFVQGASGLINLPGSASGFAAGGRDTLRFGLTEGTNTFTGLIEALRQNNLVKVLSEPTLVTMSGRPASFMVGGEFPILVPSGIATATIEFKEFGTRVDFVPIVLGDRRIRLEVRPVISEIDESRSVTVDSITVPGVRTRKVDTGVEMEVGQTLALAGLLQERTVMENKGVPWISDIPFLGVPFRRVEEQVNEIELLITVTPEIVDAMDSHQLPPCGPGEGSTSPDDGEFYGKGYHEVPHDGVDGRCTACHSTTEDSVETGAENPELLHEDVTSAKEHPPRKRLSPGKPPLDSTASALSPSSAYYQITDLKQTDEPNLQNHCNALTSPTLNSDSESPVAPVVFKSLDLKSYE